MNTDLASRKGLEGLEWMSSEKGRFSYSSLCLRNTAFMARYHLRPGKRPTRCGLHSVDSKSCPVVGMCERTQCRIVFSLMPIVAQIPQESRSFFWFCLLVALFNMSHNLSNT